MRRSPVFLAWFAIGWAMLGAWQPAAADELMIEEASYYREEGRRAQAAGRLDDALAAYTKAVASFPVYADAYNDLGVVYEATGDLKRAEDAYAAALRINPRHGPAHTNLALLYETQGRMDQAIPHWQQRMHLGWSRDPWVLQARDRLVQYRAQVPEPEEAATAKARGEVALAYEEGRFHLERRQWTDAEQAFQRVLVIDPRHRGARDGLATAQRRLAESAPAAREPVGDGWAAKSPRAGRPEVGAPIVRPPAVVPPPPPITNWTPADQRVVPALSSAPGAGQRAVPALSSAPGARVTVAPAPAAREPVDDGWAAKSPRAGRPEVGAAPPIAPPAADRPAPPVVLATPQPIVRVEPITPISTRSEARTLADQLAQEKAQVRNLMVRELYHRGELLSRQRQYALAIEQFQRALSINPDHRESQQALREAQAALARSDR